MEEVAKVLLQQQSTLQVQQSTLQVLVETQAELRSLLQKQHRSLELRLAELSRPSDGVSSACSLSLGNCEFLADQFCAAEEEKAREELEASGTNTDLPVQTHSNLNIFRAKKSSGMSTVPNKGSGIEPLAVPQSLRELRRFLRALLAHPTFDCAVGLVVLLHFALIFAELELKGRHTAYLFDPDTDRVEWSDWGPLFDALDKAFSALFLFELMLYVFAYRAEHFIALDWVRIVDVLAVALSSFDSFVLAPALGTQAVRALRVCRIFRFVRVLRFMGTISALRIFVMTLSKCLESLLYTTSVVAVIVVSSALFLSHMLQGVLEDESLDADLRYWLHEHYGSAFRCSYTMFEAAFSGKWATHLSGPLVWGVSPLFSLFFVAYTLIVNFAVIRVLAALFLKQTLDVAAIDAERAALQKVRDREARTETLRTIFNLGDVEGDGILNRKEFDAMMRNEEVLGMFQSLQLEVPELRLLFNILSEDDGVADQDEFLTGALKLTSQVTPVDVVQLLHEQLVLKRYLIQVAKGLQHVDEALHPKRPWRAISIHHQEHREDSPKKEAPKQGVPPEREEARPRRPPKGAELTGLSCSEHFETLTL